jgi:hypothetical protein
MKNIVIEVGNDSKVRKFHDHMVILNYRSSHFALQLIDVNLAQMKLPNMLSEIFLDN